MDTSDESSKLYDSDSDPQYIPETETDYSDDSSINPIMTKNNLQNKSTDTKCTPEVDYCNKGCKNVQKKNELMITNLQHIMINSYESNDCNFNKTENDELTASSSANVKHISKITDIHNDLKIKKDTQRKKAEQDYSIETVNKKTVYKRKKDMCFFCENDVLNFARHIRRNHFCEVEVQEIFSKNKNSLDRRQLLAKLKKKGNFLKNSILCEKPVKQAKAQDRSYLPCSNCLGFYTAKFLYRHKYKCCKSSKHSQAEGQNLLIKNKGRIDPRLKEEVFPRMRADKISLEAKNDFLICAFGARYLKVHREKHFITVVSRKMRELSRILLEFKKTEPSIINLFNALQPKFYDKFVDATKVVAKYDNNKDLYNSPTLAMNIATSLKQCCDIAISMLIKEDTSVDTANCEAKIKTMINLLQANWRFDVSNRAGNDLNIKKFNKVTIVPLASDLKLLKDYLILKAEIALGQLKVHSTNVTAYITLLETIYCRVILLNRRRPGELQRMLLHSYETSEKKTDSYEEFNKVVSETEKMLLKNLKRVVIRGKRGRGVPVMFSVDTQNHLKILLNVRANFLGPENPYLFGKPGSTTPICGYKVIAKYATSCGAKNPEAITCTRLRKHLATLTQLFNLNNNEIEQLSTFMGHTPGVHQNNYRLPDDVYQTAKISKLLLLMEKGGAADQKGKSLDEIDINLEENLLSNNKYNENDEEFENNTDSNLNQYLKEKETIVAEKSSCKELELKQVMKIQKGVKRTLVPWTDEQKKVVTRYFANHVKKKQPPKRFECEELKSNHEKLLENKDWLKIKVFVQNLYNKNK